MSSKVSPSPLYDLLKQLKAEVFSDLRVCLPGTIAAVDGSNGTVSVDIGVMQNVAQLNFATGRDFFYPQLVGCPVFTLQGGGVGAVMPVTVGDSCFVLFSDRTLDDWFQTGSAMPLSSLRMHNIADGIVLVGLNPLSKLLNTPLDAGEGGVCETNNGFGAKVAVNVLTHKVTVANGTQNLFLVLSNLVTALTTLNTAIATMTTSSISGGVPQAAAAANTAAIVAVQTALAALLY